MSIGSTANASAKMSGSIIQFGAGEREELRAMIRVASIDERRAADIAERMARAWVGPLAGDADVDLASCVVHKAAGFNAGLHEHVRKALRAHAGAAAWLDARGGSSGAIVRLSLDELQLGEYHAMLLWESLGAKIETPRERGSMVGAMTRTMPGASDAPGFPTFEIDLSRVPAPLPKGPIDVLFVASMDNYLNPMIPVMGELLARGLRVGVMLPGEAVGFANAARIPADAVRLAFTDVLTPELIDTVERERARVAGAWRSRAHEIAASLRHGPVDLWPLARRDLERMAVEYLPRAMQFWRAGERLVREHGVRAIVGARLRRTCDIALMLGARSAGARASILIHGHITDAPERRFDDGSFDNLDAIGAWGEDQRRVILAKSAPGAIIEPDRVLSAGNPAWDALATQDHSSTRREITRRAIADRLSIPPDRPWLVLTAQETSAPQYPAIRDAVLATPDAVLIVKTHPREDASVYEARGDQERARVRVVSSSSPALHELLLAADATITFHSTTNLESLLVGTPVITAALGELRTIDRLVFLERFGLPLASDERELWRVVAQAAGSPDGFRASLREPMARALAGLLANAGNASPKCADMIAPWSAGLVAPVTSA
ncbi:MAG: hypothetical protein JNL50_05315 [Phycisphaerae bacterium]|nr:hypothetical protein [Phycisphaerae bacterium]